MSCTGPPTTARAECAAPWAGWLRPPTPGSSEPERAAARRILLRLADAGEDESAFVRRRVPVDELEAGSDEHTAAALAALTDSRLVTADEDTLEVAHEALLREWPRLRGWLEEDAEGRRLHPAPDPRGARLGRRGPRPR